METLLKSVQNELLKTKQQLGDAINAALELGGPEFADKLTRAMKIVQF